MLTRETAIARLRATGRLGTAPNPATALTKKQIEDPLASAVSQIVNDSRRTKSARWLAPPLNHSILP